MNKAILCAALAASILTAGVHAATEVVQRPATGATNHFYIGNRPPLAPLEFIPLPGDSVHPKGWLLSTLNRQRDGLCGHLGEISVWLQKEDNAWLSKDGKGKYGWEEVPYWLRGYIELAYILNDPAMIAKSRVWIEGALKSRRADGDFGPAERFDDDHSRDFWANMLMLFSLETYYDHSHDPRVIQLMTAYFRYHLTVPDSQFLTHYWQKMRGGDELYHVNWLYNRTGDAFLRDLAEKVHRCTADWEMAGTLPNWHNVNIAEAFREPASHFEWTLNPAEERDTYADFNEVRRRYGQVPGGMFGGDENCRPGYSDPRQGVETCGMVEQMFSDELLTQITGDPMWADNCEDVAFNTYPAALTPDLRALRYLTAPNMAVSDALNHSPGIDNSGPFLLLNPFSSRCCQHNHSMGWPYFNQHLWMATPDDGLCAAIYSASEVRARVGNGTEVRIEEESHYPFEDQITFKLKMPARVDFPLYLRIPGWCASASVSVNDRPESVSPEGGRYVRIEREWRNGDVVRLTLPMQVSLRRWTANHDAVSIDYGPITFSLKVGETIDTVDSSKTAIGDSGWQKTADPRAWPSFAYHPATPWNYGLVLEGPHPAMNFKVSKRAWPANDNPFTPEGAPIEIEASARQIPEWTLDKYGLCAPLQASPAWSGQPVEKVTLIPMGAALLRISACPVASDAPDAHKWHPSAGAVPAKPLYRTTASHCNAGDTTDALADGLVPENSAEQDIPRFTWWDHRGTAEWVQYDFPAPRLISGADVYWFDDTGVGECRLPKSWRALYQINGEWKPVPVAAIPPPTRDGFNSLNFSPVSAAAIRLEIQLQPGFSGGILKWKVR